jgi:AcrR family transcriptional regulator
MPRHYKAVTDHRPIDYAKDLNAIHRYFKGKTNRLLSIYRRWKLSPPNHDDTRAIIEQVTRRLIDFALACDAFPKRTRRQLMATVKEISKRPVAFLVNTGKYDPEAVARVYEAFARGSPENRLTLSLFEVGRGPPPPAEALGQAASRAMEELAKQIAEDSQVGGQTLVLQREVIEDLSAIFLQFGGTLKRSTQCHDDPLTEFTYQGPFHDFLKLVLPPVRPFARKAGFKMESIRSLVAIPSKEHPAARKDRP